ncbi:hypothetical protein [Pedobacter sp.]|uniref:hypothetical protein n=1 Tax=Pedobacter sp. TaxID=1411316 RepID=UPI003D7F28F6
MAKLSFLCEVCPIEACTVEAKDFPHQAKCKTRLMTTTARHDDEAQQNAHPIILLPLLRST